MEWKRRILERRKGEESLLRKKEFYKKREREWKELEESKRIIKVSNISMIRKEFPFIFHPYLWTC